MPTVEIAAFANLEQAVGLEPAKSEVTIEEAIEAPTEQNIFEIINASSLTENGIGIRQENLPENPQPEQPLPTQPSTPVQELPTFNESVEKPVELVDITPEQATALEQIPEQTSEQDLQAPEQEYIESIRQQIYTETGIRLVEENVQSRATDARIVTDTSANSAAAKRNRSYIYEQLRPSQISMAITNATPEDLNAAQTKQPAKQLARAA
jgi:vancomycin resistance protein YoaR